MRRVVVGAGGHDLVGQPVARLLLAAERTRKPARHIRLKPFRRRILRIGAPVGYAQLGRSRRRPPVHPRKLHAVSSSQGLDDLLVLGRRSSGRVEMSLPVERLLAGYALALGLLGGAVHRAHRAPDTHCELPRCNHLPPGSLSCVPRTL